MDGSFVNSLLYPAVWITFLQTVKLWYLTFGRWYNVYVLATTTWPLLFSLDNVSSVWRLIDLCVLHDTDVWGDLLLSNSQFKLKGDYTPPPMFLCLSKTVGKQISSLCTVQLAICTCALIARFALQSTRSAFFIIDLSTFHNLLVEVGPHWLQHCVLCLNVASSLAGLCVSDCVMLNCAWCIFILNGMPADFFHVCNTLSPQDKRKLTDKERTESGCFEKLLSSTTWGFSADFVFIWNEKDSERNYHENNHYPLKVC